MTGFVPIPVRPYGHIYHAMKANLDDMDKFVDNWFASFTSEYYTSVFPNSAEGRRWVRQSFEQWFHPIPEPIPGRPESLILRCRDSGGKDEDPESHQITEESLAEDVGFAVAWHVRPGRDEIGLNCYQNRWSDCQNMHEITGPDLEAFFNPRGVVHEALMKDKEHIFLEFIFVVPKYQKQGVGKMVMKELMETADRLGIPIYLNTTVADSEYFQKFDFYPFPDWESEGEPVVVPMKRDAHEPKHKKTPPVPADGPHILYHSAKTDPPPERKPSTGKQPEANASIVEQVDLEDPF